LSKKEEKKEKPKRATKKAKSEKEEDSADTAAPITKEPQLSEKPLTCPICKKGTLIKGKSAYGCSEWKQGCPLRVPINIESHTLSYFELKALVSGKEIKAGSRSVKLNGNGSLDVE
jgi:DNA topoisomerase-3